MTYLVALYKLSKASLPPEEQREAYEAIVERMLELAGKKER